VKSGKDAKRPARDIVIDGRTLPLASLLRALNGVPTPQGVRLVAFNIKDETTDRANGSGIRTP
jgi:hypothetical protein